MSELLAATGLAGSASAGGSGPSQVNPADNFFTVQVLDLLGEQKHYTLDSNGSAKFETMLQADVQPIGYSRRHLASRTDTLNARVRRRVGDLLELLKQRRQTSSSSGQHNNVTDNSSSSFRHVSVDDPTDIFEFITEHVGAEVLRAAIESKPLQVRPS